MASAAGQAGAEGGGAGCFPRHWSIGGGRASAEGGVRAQKVAGSGAFHATGAQEVAEIFPHHQSVGCAACQPPILPHSGGGYFWNFDANEAIFGIWVVVQGQIKKITNETIGTLAINFDSLELSIGIGCTKSN